MAQFARIGDRPCFVLRRAKENPVRRREGRREAVRSAERPSGAREKRLYDCIQIATMGTGAPRRLLKPGPEPTGHTDTHTTPCKPDHPEMGGAQVARTGTHVGATWANSGRGLFLPGLFFWRLARASGGGDSNGRHRRTSTAPFSRTSQQCD